MQSEAGVNPWWAAMTVWGVVNVVNVLQAAGFLSRVHTGTMDVNRGLGYLMIALAIPAIAALAAFVRTDAGWFHWIGPAVFVAFIILMVVVDYARPVEFRSPMRYDIVVPYLTLFFGSILLMGLPMYTMSRSLWLVTVVTTMLLLGSMGLAMLKGVG
jgi:hypothetical protein